MLFLKPHFLSTLQALRIPRGRTVEQLIEVSSFGGNSSFTVGYINLDLTIGPIREATRFSVIDAHTSHHSLLGDPRPTSTRLCPPHTICASKASRKERKFVVLLLNAYSRKMKLISQRQSSLMNSVKMTGCSNIKA